MFVYNEIKQGNQSVFEKFYLDDKGNVLNKRNVQIPLFRFEKDGYEYFVLYDDNMNVIKSVYRYLNFDLYGSPLTTRTKAAFSLRLLYCFLSLANYDVKDIGEKELKELQFFLRGLGSVTEKYAMKTQRSANTINGYLATYRSFFEKQGIQCEALFRSKITFVDTTIGDDYSARTERVRYKSNLAAIRTGERTVPKYISPAEFKILYRLAVEKEDVLAQVIMHLMYGYGMRLGEVLGLTTEDVKEIRIDGDFVPVLLLSNRLSDQKFQYAKGKPHVVNPQQYSSKDYSSSREKIIITYEMYEQLLDYINDTHLGAMQKYPENYDKGTADIVSVRDKPETNHYIFLNQYGRVLSDQTWNNCLKRYFEETGISVDHGIRENNLSHRFRHGFAMFHARFSEHPVDVLQLQKMLRHRSVASAMIYYNPTPEDELETKTAFQAELYSMIPELKKGVLYDREM